MNPSKQQVLITGASGFVGRLLAEAELKRGNEVLGIHDPQESPDLPFKSVGIDLRDRKEIMKFINEIDGLHGVYHLAAISSVSLCQENPALCFSVNVTGTLNLLEALISLKEFPKTLYASSCEIYGKVDLSCQPISENLVPEPTNIYGLSKITAEGICQFFFRERDFPVVISRGFSHTGPGQSKRFVFPYVASILAKIWMGEAEPVIRMGNLSVRRDYLDVRDVTRAYIVMMDHADSGRVYNVTSGCCISIEEGVKKMVEISKLNVNIMQEQSRMRSYDIPQLHGNASRISKDLGWRAEITLEQTMVDLLEYWRIKEGAL